MLIFGCQNCSLRRHSSSLSHHHSHEKPHFTPAEERHILDEVEKRFNAELDKLKKKIEENLQRCINRL